MYNENLMYNTPFKGVIPCCPYIDCMYMMPSMMRSENTNNITEPSAKDTEIDESLELRENINEDNIEDVIEVTDDSRENSDFASIETEYDSNQFRSPNDVDRILRKIEKNNPMLIRRLVMYGVPYPVAIKIIRRIIYLTLQYER